ncbi:MAG: DNA-binding MarR family transcriptional regulator [Halioglobus sp.]|jgi:DNA-binding MarR family transcriptional regulator
MSKKNFDLDRSIPYLIYRISNGLNQNIGDRLKETGLTLSKWRLLSSLRSRGTSTVGELARCTVMQHAVVSRILKELEKEGLILRQQRRNDQRVVEVQLTDQGEAAFAYAYDIAEGHRKDALTGFSRTETLELGAMLRRIQDNIGIIGQS